MPRIPRSESQVSTQIANMPPPAGDGFSAPGRAMQQLGQSIGKLGDAFAAIAERQEDEHLYEAKLEALKLQNEQDLEDIKVEGEYIGDGKEYAAERGVAWGSRLQPFQERYSSAGPKVKRFVQQFAVESSGLVMKRAARFGRAASQSHLYSEARGAIEGQINGLVTPEAEARYKADPAAFEQDLARVIAESNAIIDGMPGRDERHDRLRQIASDGIKRVIGAYPAAYSINAIQSKIRDLDAQSRGPGPQGALPDDLGSVSAKYESGGRGVGFISSGRGDPGGRSYGVHQLSGAYSMGAFLRSAEGEPYRERFAGLTPQSEPFNKVYRQIAAEDPKGFAAAQHAFYTRTHYEPVRAEAERLGFDVGNRGVQEALFSMGVQHGGARTIVARASEVARGKPVEDQIRALYAARSDYVAGLSSLPAGTKQSVLNRYRSEERDALRVARQTAEPPTTETRPAETPVPREANHMPASDAGKVPTVVRPSVESFLAQELRKALPALKQRYRAEVASNIKAVEDNAAKGTLPTEAEQARIAKMVTGAGDEQLAAAYQNALLTGAVNAQYKTAPPNLIADEVTRQRLQLAQQGAQIVPKRGGSAGADGNVAEGLDPVTATTVKKVEALEKLHERMTAELKKDPRSWAAEAGIIVKTPEIARENLGPEILAARAAEVDQIAAHYGEEYRKYFNPDEKERMKEVFRQGGQPMMALAGMMVEAFGPNAVAAFKEFSQDAPEAAALGWLVANKAGNQTTKDLADAVALRHADGAKFQSLAPKADDARNRALAIVGRGLGHLPQSEQRAIQVANALYEVRARRAGIDPKTVDGTIWDQAYREALGENTVDNVVYGGPASRGGFLGLGRADGATLIPPNVRQDALPSLMAALTLAELAPGLSPRVPQGQAQDVASELDALPSRPVPVEDSKRGGPVRLATLQRATLVNAGGGDGRYWLALADPYGDSPQWVRDPSQPDGRYVLDLKALEPVLRKRVPGAYRPY